MFAGLVLGLRLHPMRRAADDPLPPGLDERPLSHDGPSQRNPPNRTGWIKVGHEWLSRNHDNIDPVIDAPRYNGVSAFTLRAELPLTTLGIESKHFARRSNKSSADLPETPVGARLAFRFWHRSRLIIDRVDRSAAADGNPLLGQFFVCPRFLSRYWINRSALAMNPCGFERTGASMGRRATSFGSQAAVGASLFTRRDSPAEWRSPMKSKIILAVAALAIAATPMIATAKSHRHAKSHRAVHHAMTPSATTSAMTPKATPAPTAAPKTK